MEKRLKNYIDENVEDLKTQLDQLHDRFETDSANGKGTTQSMMSLHYIDMLRKVDQRMQKIQEELHRNLEAAIAERLNANKKRSASAAFGDIDDSEKLTNAQQPLIRNHSGALEMNLESHQIGQYPLMQFGKRFEFQLNNAQTHLESAVCEIKSGTYKRLACLDERVSAMEEKMDKMILLME
ncbi:hypothetical protein CFAM422_004354 [Trichoderma lentiforme]|uniref:Uncharacterized protein n=1 Tax=Trichoderma lentiforme TaxID=1567552 RepID=A0A9P4XIM6_9HYPO|nr:hypothetical protein CFAM422_004354 [Trichoderma lentiforme]